MTEQILQQILGEMKEIRGEVKEIRDEVKEIRGEVKEIRGEVKEIRMEQQEMKRVQQQIAQAVLETADSVKRIESVQTSFENKVLSDLNTHEYTIDILCREQLKIKADIEKIKNR